MHASPVEVCTTERLRLRWPSAADAPFFYRLMNDADWLRFIGDRGIRTEQDAAAYIETRLLDGFRRLGFGLCVVESLEGGEPLGICGLIKRDSLDDVDLGFAFLAEHRGRGHATEAGRATVADARERLGFKRIVAITTSDNVESGRVLERLGMRFERMMPGGDGEPPLRLYATADEPARGLGPTRRRRA